MMCVSVVVLSLGMVLGIVMDIREDFTLQPAHAHLNLVGGVLLFLFALYYASSRQRDRAHWQKPRGRSISPEAS
jgi:hypothetical protein